MRVRGLLLGLAVCLLGAAVGSQEKAPAGSPVNRLAVELLKRGLKGPVNAVCSPYSVGSALALTCAAAAGPTQTQLSRALQLPAGDVLPRYGQLRSSLAGLAGPGLEWAGANRLWAARPFEASYLTAVRESLGAEPVQISFSRAEEARGRINDWVGQQTNKQINELLLPGEIGPQTELVLTNALYFKGAWRYPFDPKATAPAQFRREDGQPPVEVPMMNQERELPCSLHADSMETPVTEEFDVLELPYQGGRVVMNVLLPRGGRTLAQAVSTLTAEKLETAVKGVGGGQVIVALPRFSLKHRLDLQPVVQELAGPLPFSAACDLSGGLGAAGRGLPLQSVVHAARLDTDEAGSTAAAATAVVALRSGPELFRADHPFLVLLRDRQTGTILFLGRVEDPSK